MRTIALILVCLGPVFLATAQEKPDSTVTDSSRGPRLYDPEFPLAKSPLHTLPYFDTSEIGAMLLSPTGSPGIPQSSLEGSSFVPMDISAPYKLQLERQKQLAPLVQWLGAVQLAGTAYIAYRHIKKYGFLK